MPSSDGVFPLASPTTLSDGSRALLESPAVEGKVLHRYRDSGGKWTIGVGHLLSPKEVSRGSIVIGGRFVPWAKGLTAAQCDALCAQDVGWAEAAVRKDVVVALRQQQFDALVIFTFNVGPENLRESSLLRDLNAGRYDAVPAQLARWIYVSHKKSPGLVHRRAVEAALWRET